MKHKSLTASMVVLAVGIALSVWGDSTTLSISNGTDTVTSPATSTLNFPISRGGDTSYDAFVQYQTQDGTAISGIDYTPAMGSIVIPAGMTSATIPVTVAGSNTNQSDKTFQMMLLGGGGAAKSFTPSFATQQTFATGGQPYSATTADLNGDGKPDLIVANDGDNTVSVLLNTTAPGATAPSFATQQTFAVGAAPFSVTVADVNGDGLPDLIVANYNGTVSVLLNTTAPGAATPSFATQQTFATGNFTFSVTAADINGDGRPDLIVANFDDNTVSVLLNTTAPGATTPSFATQQTFAVSNSPISVTVADANGDGRPDLIAANYYSNTVSVLLNTTAPGAATPSFATQQTFATGNNPTSVAVADLNGDGKPDLIVANEGFSGPGGNTVSVLLNTTAPGAVTTSFATQQTFATGSEPFSVTAVDLNGDGKPDLIVANSDGTVSVLLNTTAPGATNPSFITQQTFSAMGFNLFSVTAADVNGDGRPDLVVANYNDNTVSVLLNTTPAPATTFDSNSFATQQTFATGTAPASVAAADLNGDGKPDLIVANRLSNTVSVLLNTSPPGAITPSFAAQQTFGTGAGSYPYSVAAADLNGDGRPDLIIANDNQPGTVAVLLNTSAPGATTPSFAAQQTFAVGSYPASVTAADVNGDGKPDLIVANFNNSNSGTVSVLLNTTAPGATTPSFAIQHTFATGDGPFSVTAADINGDGRPDLIVTNTSFPGSTVSVLLNATAPGAATPSFATQQAFATGNNPDSVTVADVNGDGKPDLIVANGNDNTVSVLLNATAPGATTPSFATQQTFALSGSPASVTTADVNGDGKPDLIVANGANTTTVLLNTTAPGASTPSFAPPQNFASGGVPSSVTTVNLNGDGKPDLIVANYSSNTVSVLLNALYATTISGSPATGTIHYGVPTATPTPTATATATATDTATATPTATATGVTPTPTATSTGSVGATPTATPTAAPTTSISVPASLAMGNAPVGDTVTKNLTVKNTGTNPLFIGNVTSNDPEFAATGATTCPPGGLAHLATCTIAIGFTPSSLGAHSATLSVNDNTASSPQHVAASGTGIVTMTVTPTSYAFGSVKDGSKAVKAITVHNYQTNPVTLTLPPSFSGANSGDFSVTGGTCTATLLKTSACALYVTYAPTGIGTESATMTVTDSPDPLGPYTVAFSAAATVPESLSATKMVFGNVRQRASKTLSITVTNKATSGSITLTGTNLSGSSDFAITGGTCTGTLAASSSCTYAVTFTPSTETAESGTLSIGVAEDPNGGPPAVRLSGTGVTPLIVAPAAGIAFGTITVGNSSLNKTVTVYNYGGAAVSLSESITIVTGNSGDFAVTGGTCGATLAGAGAYCTYTLKFTPSIVGGENATIGVSAVGDAASPHNVSLTGTGM